ncbi:PP2C family protein-serine/threonine phosphatase [Roseococcus suduntuyensis]|uniref:Protein phosphatase/serine/threonine-protein phosphatase Stp1 n=1 Tax=Roseococcus suduntuyensis TaxID=455361 RepID=A0A840A4J5_9PROT|nr:protein phosphatase 2C domain-containing protein [Roseococcus suduntuyensis]MBB3896888.1 protein phosphatase/serine/threonine-protein phosphatase Stp1 [Roseococcus suduntuyensis]
MSSSAATHPGAVRPRNEDQVVARPDLGLWAVADGAGGHGAGEVASGAIAEALEAIPPGLTAAEMLAQVRLRLAAVHAALRVRALARGPGGIIASTVVVLLLRGGHFAALWAGDSRLYLLREGVLRRVTRDHSAVQEMVDSGLLAEAEAERHPHANVITRAVGQEGEVVLDKVADRLLPGDQFLLCSDGLFKDLPEAGLGAMLSAGMEAPAFIEAALRAGARDNVSAVVVRV